MKTLYGELPNDLLIAYVDGLIDKIFKLLPLREENSLTLNKYIEGLLREIIGGKELIEELKNNQDIISILGILQNLMNENNFESYRSDIFKCINLVKKIKKSLGSDK